MQTIVFGNQRRPLLTLNTKSYRRCHDFVFSTSAPYMVEGQSETFCASASNVLANIWRGCTILQTDEPKPNERRDFWLRIFGGGISKRIRIAHSVEIPWT